jgi:hypothetical protein
MSRTPVLLARVIGALLVLAAGAIHLWLYFDYFHRVHVVGVLFLLNAAAAAVIGTTLFLSARLLVVGAGVGFAAATLAGFFVSVYNGLFGYVESLTGPWQEAAAGVEIAAIVVLLPPVLAAYGGTTRAAGKPSTPRSRRSKARNGGPTCEEDPAR